VVRSRGGHGIPDLRPTRSQDSGQWGHAAPEVGPRSPRIVGALGLVGGLLAALGLNANLAFHVRGQLPELGIRVALGATRTRILSGVVLRGLASAGAGLLVGLAAWWAGRGQLGEIVGSADASMSLFAVGTTTVLVLALTLIAVSLPALRASRADPLESLKPD